jgi:phosphopantetheinyl transferase (holo-ACP synthase)
MPPATDFREDAFYSMNFAPAEIAYCILQSNPLTSFTGLFAAKEAIVKADNHFLNLPFSYIVIDHLPNGKPVHPNFSLSISHTAGFAVTVAVANTVTNASFASPANGKGSVMPLQNFTSLYIIAFSAFVLSLLLLILFILK